MKKTRVIIDAAMSVLMPLLMAYSLIGETLHELFGTLIFALLIAHHLFNRKWYGSVFRGKYNAARVFRTAHDFLLLIFMVLQPISGVLLSKHIYTFLPHLPVSAQARSVHMLLAYWGYAPLGVHTGTHLAAPLGKLYKRKRPSAIAMYILLCGISVYGCAAFIKRGFPGYMFAEIKFAFFDQSESTVLFILDYLAVMVLFMTIGWLVISLLNKPSEKKKRGDKKVVSDQ